MSIRIHLRKSVAIMLLTAMASVADVASAQYGQTGSLPQADVPAESAQSGKDILQAEAPKRDADVRRVEEERSAGGQVLERKYRRAQEGEGVRK